MRRGKAALLDGAIGVVIVLAALLAGWVSPYDPIALNLAARLQPPSAAHLMGTDSYGRDVLSRVIYGSRISLQVGVVAVLVGLLAGLPLGLLAGYYRGRVDAVIGQLVDMLLAIPGLILALSFAAAFGTSVPSMMAAIGVTFIAPFARVVRASVFSLREQDFVTSARATGASDWRIIGRHIVPNALSPVIVLGSLLMAHAILIESSLSFIGLGTPPPTPTWGNMLTEGRETLRAGPWLSSFAGLAIMLTVLAFNLVGDALRDQLDPRLRRNV